MQPLEQPHLLRLTGQYGRLRGRLGPELGSPVLVLPTGEYFPDHFDGSARATQRLLERMQAHAHIEDIPVTLMLDDQTASARSCSTGACAPSGEDTNEPRLVAHDQGWVLRLDASEVAHPVALTSIVARALGLVFLEETRARGQALPQPLPVHQELAAVMLGFGVLLLEGSHVYSKGCGGPKISQLTALGVNDLAWALALFCEDNRINLKPALKNASATQRTALEAASATLRGNPTLLEWVRSASELDPDPELALAPPRRPLFGGLFERASRKADPDDIESFLERGLPAHTPPRLASGQERSPRVDAELKALVAEALEK